MTTRSNGDHSGSGHHNAGSWYPQRRPHYGYGGGSASFRGCCCCLFLLLTFLALLALAVALVVVLVVKPRKPQFDLNQVSVQYLLVATPSSPAASPSTPAAPGAAYLSLNITLLFTAVNPNKVGIRYGATAFDVMYHGVPLGVAAVPGFEQPAHSTRLLQTRVIVDRFNVLQADAQDLVRDAAIYDRVDLRITGDVGAKILVLGFSSPKVQVSVDCAIAISPRSQSLKYKQCGVDGLSV
uniref:Late embryogenesis abundant protein LEA-2 subgroup domain-containing protein n=1 Tax=Arundo donax TaxID=35708 RepID=A0A0A9DJJ7_ARUDO